MCSLRSHGLKSIARPAKIRIHLHPTNSVSKKYPWVEVAFGPHSRCALIGSRDRVLPIRGENESQPHIESAESAPLNSSLHLPLHVVYLGNCRCDCLGGNFRLFQKNQLGLETRTRFRNPQRYHDPRSKPHWVSARHCLPWHAHDAVSEIVFTTLLKIRIQGKNTLQLSWELPGLLFFFFPSIQFYLLR